jgi:tRNA-modifying protein YgfZ
MPNTILHDRAILLIGGPESEAFLQNLVTADLNELDKLEARPSALLSPQGKILFDFLISRAEAGALRLECRAAVAPDLVRRLMLYKLRAKVEIGAPQPAKVAVFWDTYMGIREPESALVDMRFPGPHVSRSYDALPEPTEQIEDWHFHRILNGVAESGSDYELGDVFPHDVLLDQNGGIGFSKGCYVGQEVVSRMQHRGTARRRILIVDAGSDLPPSGTPITVAGRPIGSLGTVVRRDGLAMIRIDKVAEAMRQSIPIVTGDVALRFEIPEWARFTFPSDAVSAGEA